MKLSEGTLFAEKYELIEQLGRGGFSEVWLAKYMVADGLWVAIKIYAPGMGLDVDGQKMFTEEFKLVFNLTHTNLLRPTQFDVWEKMPYLIMPYCKNGSTFSRYVVAHKMITEEEAWKVFHDVAAGLAYLHEKKPPIIHQDIKPDNILIDDDGRYMITDFGISSKVQSTIRKNTNTILSGGTFAYMAPERFSANPMPIMASDVWSLGAMMYELMMGVPPFGNHGGVLQKNGAEIPIIEGDYSQKLKTLVYGCLAKEAWNRPNSRTLRDFTYDHLHDKKLSTDIVKKPVQPKPTPSPRKSTTNEWLKSLLDLWGNKDRRKWLIGSIAALLVLPVVLFATCGGTKEVSVVDVVKQVEVDSTANYDFMALVRLEQAVSLKTKADQFSTEHKENLLDEDNGCIEDQYMESLVPIEDFLKGVYSDSISKDVRDSLIIYRQKVFTDLNNLYEGLLEKSAKMKELKQVDVASRFEKRANKIDSVIKIYIRK